MLRNLFFLFLIFLLFGGAILYLNVMHPGVVSDALKKQAIEQLLGRPMQTAQSTANPVWRQYKGVSISFLYPENATVSKGPLVGAMTDSISFEVVNPRIIVTIQAQAGSDLLQLPAVRIRQQSDEFLGTDEKSCLEFFKKEDTVEKSIFCEKNNIMYSFVATGSDQDITSEYLQKVFASASF